MELTVTKRAQEKGIRKLELLHMEETENYIVGVLHESRNKASDKIDWVDPIIFFKSDIKHGDYDRIKKMAEAAGLLFLLPEADNFKTDYYSIECKGILKMIKSWGYASTNLPPTRRWNEFRIREAASIWFEDIATMAKIIDSMYQDIKNEMTEDQVIANLKERFDFCIA